MSKQTLADIAAERVRNDIDLQERFADEGIHAIDIRRVLGEILAKEPIVAMPIDAVKDDLREWATTLRIPVKLWIVRKYVEFGKPENVMYEIPEEFGPVAATAVEDDESQSENARYDVTLADLIDAGLVTIGQRLLMPYKPRNGEQRTYEGIVCDDGSIEVLGKRFSSPSYAAVFGIQDAGSTRKTVNGWKAWRTDDGEQLSIFRGSSVLCHVLMIFYNSCFEADHSIFLKSPTLVSTTLPDSSTSRNMTSTCNFRASSIPRSGPRTIIAVPSPSAVMQEW